MEPLPILTLAGIPLSPVALIPLAATLLLAWRPHRILRAVALMGTLPLLWTGPGPGLVAVAVALGLLGRAGEQDRAQFRLAAVWLAVALVSPAPPVHAASLAVGLAVSALAFAAGLTRPTDPAGRFALAAVLVLVPFAPTGTALLQPAHVTAALPYEVTAARWAYRGPGEWTVADLLPALASADRIARALLLAGVLAVVAGGKRLRPWQRVVPVVLGAVALGLLLGQSVLVLDQKAHGPGLPQVADTQAGVWSGRLGLTLARLFTLLALWRDSLATDRPVLYEAVRGPARWVPAILAALALLVWSLAAPAWFGPMWLAGPVPLGVLAGLVAALVRIQAQGAWTAAVASGLFALAGGAVLGGAATGWSVATALLQ